MSTETAVQPKVVKLGVIPFAIMRGVVQACLSHGEALKKEKSFTRQSFGDDFQLVAEMLDGQLADDKKQAGFVLIPAMDAVEALELVTDKLVNNDKCINYLEMINRENIDTANDLDATFAEITTKLGTDSINTIGGRELLMTRLDNLLTLERKEFERLQAAPKKRAKKSAKKRK